MTPRDPPADGVREWGGQVRRDGFVGRAADLDDPGLTEALLADRDLFDRALADIRAAGEVRVPYLVTEAIARAGRDAAVRAAARAVLGTDEWVMWGSNIRVSTPNAAHHWHVDLEAFLWPSSITLAIGLAGCAPEGATWFVPGTHRARRGPRPSDALDARGVQVGGFGDGRFYAFNARCWHRGDPTTSAGRVVLFTHLQRASEPRVPTMLDYRVDEWSREPAAYWAAPECRSVNTSVYRPPLRNVVGGWVKRLWRAR